MEVRAQMLLGMWDIRTMQALDFHYQWSQSQEIRKLPPQRECHPELWAFGKGEQAEEEG